MTWKSTEPYNDLPELPPTVEIETKAVLKLTVEARAAIASLDQASRRIPNPTVLINSIPILEAQASSEIENIVTTADELFKYSQDDSTSASVETKETLRYRTALLAGYEGLKSRPLSVTTAMEICAIVQSREISVRNMPGTYIGNPTTKRAIYTPPSGESVIRNKLANWEQFIHNSAHLDPLVVMSLAHYQFEAIHPFPDGNGRTGRILNILHLVDAGLLQQPILYLSRYIIRHRDDYYRLLLEVTANGAWTDWTLFMLEGLRQTALSTVRKIDAIHELQERIQIRMRAVTPAGANADLLAVLFEQPYCRISNVMSRCRVSRPTATGWLNALVEAEVLLDMKVGRERIFVNTEFFALLVRDDDLDDAQTLTLF